MIDMSKRCLPFILTALFILLYNDNSYAQSYWQQEVKYEINALLDDEKHILNCDEKITYINNSPNTLEEIWIHIWPNAYRTTGSPYAKHQLENRDTKFEFAKKEERGAIDSLNFMSEGRTLELIKDPAFPDIVKLKLFKLLLPGDSVIITTPFTIKIPNSFSRLGHVDQSYQITQWYPKPAVYDQRGWHPIPYLDQGEFYSEFGSFDVKITLPENYVVGATGVLQTESENNFLDSLSAATEKLSSFSSENNFPASSRKMKTLHYKQNNVHDFAWFADKRFHVLKSKVTLPHSKRDVITYVMFTPKNAKYWTKAINYVNDAVYYYSVWNGDYPYDYCTAVDGALSAGSGMEYPMITVIGEVSGDKMLDRVIAHEVGHNWFYGILGSNEREHGWMDEGINSYFENRYMRTKYERKKMLGHKKEIGILRMMGFYYFPADYEQYLTYQYTASRNLDQPIQTHSEQFTKVNYGCVMYAKAGIVFRYLQEYLGTAVFDSAMKVYYETWKFKHPYPEDIEAVFEEVSGQDLDWFFKELIHTNEELDFSIEEIKKENNQLRLKIANNAPYPSPVFIESKDKEDNVVELLKTPPYTGNIFVYMEEKRVKKITLDPYSIIPESKRNNNTIRVNGPFKKVEPLRLQFLAGLDRPDRTTLYFTPIAGYNVVDGFMPGLALYNHVYPFKNFEWEAVPLYGLKSERMNGTGRVAFIRYPDYARKTVTSINFSSFSDFEWVRPNYSHYSRFRKIAFKYEIELKKSYERSNVTRFVDYRAIHIKHTSETKYDGNILFGTYTNEYQSAYQQINFRYNNRRVYYPISIHAQYEMGGDYSNILFVGHHKLAFDFRTKLNYKKSDKGIDVRFFTGAAIGARGNNAGVLSVSGNSDYVYDRAFVNRYQLEQQQFYLMDGGFKSYTYTPPTNFITSLNLKIPFNLPIPIGVFGDGAYFNEFSNNIAGSKEEMTFIYDAGIYLPIIPELIEVYFPLYVSNYDSIFGDDKPRFKEQVRLMINLNEMQPFRLLRNINLF